MKSSRKIIWRFIRSYLLVALPMLVISGLVTQMGLQRLRDKEMQVVQQRLDAISYQMEVWEQSHYEKNFTLLRNEELTPRNMLADSIHAKRAIDILRNVKAFDSGVSDIFLDYKDGNIYSTRGKSSIRVYFENIFNLQGLSVEKSLKQLESGQRNIVLLKSNKGEAYLLYHYPIEIGKESYGSINYMVDMRFWNQSFQDIFSGIETIFSVEVAGEEVVYCQGTENDFRKYICVSEKLSCADMSLLVYYNPMAMYKDVQSMQWMNTLLLAVGLLISVVLAYTLGKKSGERINELAQTILTKKRSTKKGKKYGTDGFDYIQDMLEQMVNESSQLEQDANIYRETMLAQASRLLFHGLFRDIQTARRLFAECGVELFEEYYYLCGVWFATETEAIRYRKNNNHCLIDMIPLEKGYLIVFLEELAYIDPTFEYRKSKIMLVRKQLKELNVKDEFVVCSQVYMDLSLANYALIEAMGLIEQLRTCGIKEIYWDEYVKKYQGVQMMFFTQDMMEDFLLALENKDGKYAKKILNQMRHYMVSNEITSENKRYLRYQILQMIVSVLRKMEQENFESLIAVAAKVDPADERKFYERVEHLLTSIGSCDASNDYLGRAVKYVDNNFTRYELSLEEVAEHVGCSKNHISNLFKQKIGCNYIDYLTKLRMERVKILLETTDIPIKDIMTAVGYIDKGNFSRKFKAFYGINASEWRKKRKDEMKL